MKLPKSVKVGGHHLRVRKQKRKDINGADANYRSRVGDISIADDLHPSFQSSALLHEVLHACFHISGLHYQLSSKNEEAIVTVLEPILYQVMRDNPKLIGR